MNKAMSNRMWRGVEESTTIQPQFVCIDLGNQLEGGEFPARTFCFFDRDMRDFMIIDDCVVFDNLADLLESVENERERGFEV